ncbi:MAG: hypothetical protein M3O15_02640 [Acidobacteriota bacterium]|nr:hypothetical protein [Acidobacteriota bacterium]
MRDGYQYDVRVDDGGRSRSVRVHDGAMPPAIAPLVEWLVEEARERRP